jgi:hypothetical protein
MKWLKFGFLLFLSANCDKQLEPEKPITPPPDPIPVVVEPEELEVSCRTACDNQRSLGCELGRDTPEGSTCEEICGNSMSVPAMAWDVSALTYSKGCSLQ